MPSGVGSPRIFTTTSAKFTKANTPRIICDVAVTKASRGTKRALANIVIVIIKVANKRGAGFAVNLRQFLWQKSFLAKSVDNA